MARSLEQILRDLESLTTATKTVDQDLKDLYRQYLEVLSKALKKQLILATYHLCTQVYPEAFLQLSVSQREKVQAGIRKIADQGRSQMEQLGWVVIMDPSLSNQGGDSAESNSEENPDTNILDDDQSTLVDTDTEALSTDAATLDTETLDAATLSVDVETMQPDPLEIDDNATEIYHSEQESPVQDNQDTSEIAERLSSALSLFAAFGSEPLSPINLAKRHVLLERQLRSILQTLSSLANYLLKQAHVLPDLPEMVIAAAAEAEAGESGQNTPNLLNVLVEMGSERTQNETNKEDSKHPEAKETLNDDDPESSMTHLVAINLRLADIEFADAHTALWRSKLQEALARLKRLGSRYQKLQREKAQAEAEHAWRATWFEE